MGRPDESNPQHSTARRFSKPPPLLRWAVENELLPDPANALVFGAGFLAEADVLRKRKWKVDALDLPEAVAKRQKLYDRFSRHQGCRVLTSVDSARMTYRLITVTHVLEFIESPRFRQRLLADLGSRLPSSGILLLSLRGWSDVRAAQVQTPKGDGLVTGNNTWVRGYTMSEARDLVRRAHLEIYASPHSARAERPEQVRLICHHL
jgi:hypothetical protein